MPKDDWIRITLRLPPELHARVTEAAQQSGSSLNHQIITVLSDAFGADEWAQRLASMSVDEFVTELKVSTAQHHRRVADLEFRLKAVEDVGNKIIATMPDEKPRRRTPRAANEDMPSRNMRTDTANDDRPPIRGKKKA